MGRQKNHGALKLLIFHDFFVIQSRWSDMIFVIFRIFFMSMVEAGLREALRRLREPAEAGGARRS